MSSVGDFQFDELFISSSPQHPRNSSFPRRLTGSRGSISENESVFEENNNLAESFDEEDQDQEETSQVVDEAQKASLRESIAISSAISLDSFVVRTLVGKGAYGKVRQVVKKDSNEVFAMKSLFKKHLIDTNCVENTMAERDILRKVRHPFIVRLHYAFQNTSKLYLVMEFVNGGHLLYHMRKSRWFAENRARFYIAEVILAIEHLHSLDIIHRDLKPENVLLGSDGHCVLTDFGFAKENVTNPDSCKSFCGTMEYMAPEVIQKNRYGKAADWWSVGILLFDMLCGHPPFESPDDKTLCDKILSAKLKLPPCSSACANLLNGLLCRNIEKRFTIQRIKNHKFFNGMNWDKLSNKELPPPFLPKADGELDVSNFDSELTTMAFGESPGSPLSSSMQAQFVGFSYVRSFDGTPLRS